MHPLKYRAPGQVLSIAFRCHHSEMRYRPDPARVNILGYWLGKAQARHPGVEIFTVCQMSNHIHIEIRDNAGEASEFVGYWIGNASKDLNLLDQRRGAVVERRFGEIPVLDDDALARRCAYTVCNPVKAKLVRSVKEWKGLSGFAGSEARTQKFTKFHELRYEAAVLDAQRTKKPAPERADFIEVAVVSLAIVEPELAAKIQGAVEATEAELRSRIQPDEVRGMKSVLRSSPFDRPKRSKWSPKPLCFASTLDAFLSFRSEWYDFVDAFRRASERFRAGELDALFPSHCFRPSPG